MDDHCYYLKQLQAYMHTAAVSNRVAEPGSNLQADASLTLNCVETYGRVMVATGNNSLNNFLNHSEAVSPDPKDQPHLLRDRCSLKLEDDDGFFSEWCNIIMASS
jgi:hypothetical protein